MSLISAVPKLIPVLRMNARVSETQALFTNRNKNTRCVIGTLFGGTVTTIKNNLGFEMNLKNLSGYGTLESFTDQHYGNLDNKLTGNTDDGVDVEMTYLGVLRAPVGADAVIEGTKQTAKEYYLSNSPRFKIFGKIPKNLEWVVKENFIGSGTFTVKDGVRYGEYTIYVIR